MRLGPQRGLLSDRPGGRFRVGHPRPHGVDGPGQPDDHRLNALLASLAAFDATARGDRTRRCRGAAWLWLPVLAELLVLSWWSRRWSIGRIDEYPDQDPPSPIGRSRYPVGLRTAPALILAAVLTGALLVGRWGAEVLEPRSSCWPPSRRGLADAHAGSVAAASLAAKGDITVDTALISVAAALGSNLIVKTVLAFTAGGRRFGIGFLAAMAVSVAGFRRRAHRCRRLQLNRNRPRSRRCVGFH